MHSVIKISMSYLRTSFLLPLSSSHLSVLRLAMFISDLNSTKNSWDKNFIFEDVQQTVNLLPVGPMDAACSN